MDAESLILRGNNIFLHGLTNATLTRGIANLFAAIKTLLLTLELLPLRASLAHIFVNLFVLYNKLHDKTTVYYVNHYVNHYGPVGSIMVK